MEENEERKLMQAKSKNTYTQIMRYKLNVTFANQKRKSSKRDSYFENNNEQKETKDCNKFDDSLRESSVTL